MNTNLTSSIDPAFIKRVFGPESKRLYPLFSRTFLMNECIDDMRALCDNVAGISMETFEYDVHSKITLVSSQISDADVRAIKMEFGRFVNTFTNPKLNLQKKIKTLMYYQFIKIRSLIERIGYSIEHSKIFRTYKSIFESCLEYLDNGNLSTLIYSLEKNRMFLQEFDMLLFLSDRITLPLIFFRYDLKPNFQAEEIMSQNTRLNNFDLSPSIENFKKLYSIEAERFHLFREDYCKDKLNRRLSSLMRITSSFFWNRYVYQPSIGNKSYLKNGLDMFTQAFEYMENLKSSIFSESDYIDFMSGLKEIYQILDDNKLDLSTKATILSKKDITFLEIVNKLGFSHCIMGITGSEEFKIYERVKTIKKLSLAYAQNNKLSARKLLTEYAIQLSFFHNFINACSIGYEMFIPVLWRYGIEVKRN